MWIGRVWCGVVGVMVVCGVAGCAGDPDPVGSVSSVPSVVVSSGWGVEEQRVVDVVQEYLGRWNQISHDPAGSDLESIREYAADPIAQGDLNVWAYWVEHGWRLEGDPVFTPMEVERTVVGASSQEYVVIGCYSLEGSDIYDDTGTSMGGEGRVELGGSRYTVRVSGEGYFVVKGEDVDISC